MHSYSVLHHAVDDFTFQTLTKMYDAPNGINVSKPLKHVKACLVRVCRARSLE